jgi:hypothetical protein
MTAQFESIQSHRRRSVRDWFGKSRTGPNPSGHKHNLYFSGAFRRAWLPTAFHYVTKSCNGRPIKVLVKLDFVKNNHHNRSWKFVLLPLSFLIISFPLLQMPPSNRCPRCGMHVSACRCVRTWNDLIHCMPPFNRNNFLLFAALWVQHQPQYAQGAFHGRRTSSWIKYGGLSVFYATC